jgi:UDP-N-acetylglucosamine 2-epimerase (non-hydrolysing)
MLRVMSVIGTRPEAIKMAPVIRELAKYPTEVQSITCSTGQHRQMLDQVFDLFSIRPDYELNIMQPNQRLAPLTGRLFESLDRVMAEVKPDWVLAQGDTTTVLVASMVAYYQRIPFGHVEAGLRTGNLNHPFPEEMNRRAADIIAELCFAPTELSRQNLLREGCPEARILVTGNTVIDALHMAAAMPYDWSAGPLAKLPRNKRLVLVTSHRRENVGQRLRDLCMAIRDLAAHPAAADVQFVLPVHLNPNVRDQVHATLGPVRNVSLLEPLDYLSLVQLMKRSSLVVTDSGGIQEEAPGLGVPVLVARETTERPEGVSAGVVKLVGTSRTRIRDSALAILTDPTIAQSMRSVANPYGDGKAAQRIVSRLMRCRQIAAA